MGWRYICSSLTARIPAQHTPNLALLLQAAVGGELQERDFFEETSQHFPPG